MTDGSAGRGEAGRPARCVPDGAGRWLAFACMLSAMLGYGLAAYAQDVVQVAQRGRSFAPGELELRRGATVRFVNDDGKLLHHVYSKGDGFQFDIGEQAPGAAVDVRFVVPGTFTVLCGIHPRMRLQVLVR